MYVQKPHLKARADISSGAKGLYFGVTLHLHPYFVKASSEGSGVSGRMHRLTRVFAAHRCDKYWNLVYWPILIFSCSEPVHFYPEHGTQHMNCIIEIQ